VAKVKRDPIWLIFCAVALLGVAACALLGGPTRAPIIVDCHDGTTCPNGYACPPLAGGQCEADIEITESWGDHVVDAGH
jgi:hypothetical protein